MVPSRPSDGMPVLQGLYVVTQHTTNKLYQCIQHAVGWCGPSVRDKYAFHASQLPTQTRQDASAL